MVKYKFTILYKNLLTDKKEAITHYSKFKELTIVLSAIDNGQILNNIPNEVYGISRAEGVFIED